MTWGDPAPQDRPPNHVPRRAFTPGRLQETLEAHERWIRSRGRDGKRAELFEADLGRANLRRAVLTEANLKGADLERALLEGARLQGADLQHASLRGADLQRAALQRANLQGADLFEANLATAELYETNLQAVNFLTANLQQADLQQANLQRALLKEATLQGAELQGANLQGANLQGANLIGANMQRAVLHDANLSGANLREANLQGAELQGSTLQGTALQLTILRDADLAGTLGLVTSQLAGADVAGTRLPENITPFTGLATVRDLAKQARRLLLWLVLGCGLAWLSISATTDAMLLTSAPLALFPHFPTPIPSVGFYAVMPILLVVLFIYFHLHLLRLWEDLAALPAVFPDGRPLDRTVYPWLIHGLVRVYNRRLRDHRPPLSRLQTGICFVVGWWLVPITLLLFWGRYLPRHDWGVSTLHVTLLVVTIGFMVLFHSLARTVLRGRALRRYKHGAVALLVACVTCGVFSMLSIGALLGTPAHLFTTGLPAPATTPTLTLTDIRRLVPYLFALVGYKPFADLAGAEVSTRLAPRAGQEDESLMLVKGAPLKNRNLRYVNAAGAFLVNADLRGADLVGADLRHADLRGAQLNGAALQGADLRGADLRKASGLSRTQIAVAYTDSTTRLPAALKPPVNTPPEEQSG